MAIPKEVASSTEIQTEAKENVVLTGSQTEPTYEVSELLANAPILFGAQSEVLAGALHGATKERYTIKEIKELIKQFLEKKVKA